MQRDRLHGAKPWADVSAAILSMLGLWLLSAMCAPAAVASDLALSPAERAWVEQHPEVTFALPGPVPPYFTVDDRSGEPQGYVIEMMALAAERAGLRVAYRQYPSRAAALAAVGAGHAVGVPFQPAAVGADTQSLLTTRPMLTANSVLAVRRDVPDISPASDFGGYRVAVEAGSGADALLGMRFPHAVVRRHDTPEAALRAVASGDADLFIGDRRVAVHFIETLLLANVQVRGSLGPGLAALGPGIDRSLPLLHGVLDKAMESITQSERAQLAARWLPPDLSGTAPGQNVALTAAESEWLNAHGRVRVGYDALFAPITVQSDMSQLRGLGADFVRLAAGKVGITIESEVGGSFAQIYQAGLEGRLDVIVGAARTSARRQHYDFVGPFLRVPTGIVTASAGTLLVTRLEELGRQRLALLDDHFLIPQLRNRFPALTLMTFPDQDAALEAVASGRADASIGNLRVVNQLINDRFTGRVRVTGTVADADSELYLAVRNDLPQLTRLLRKGLDAVSPAESAEIERRWLAVTPADGLSWPQAARVGVLVLAVLAWLGIWAFLLRRGNRRLRAARRIELEARQLAEATTASRGRFLEYLSHELRGTLGAIAAGATMVRTDPSADRRARLLDAIQASADGFHTLLETTLQYEQQLDRPLALHPTPVDLWAQWTQMLAPFELAATAKGLSIDASLEGVGPGADRVLIDITRWRQVMNNLVGNAIKFTKAGGVQVQGRLQQGVGGLTFELRVADSGPGLSETDCRSLFQPYAQGEQGQRLRQGAGLGLAITRQIVDAMGGTIAAGASSSGGALFTVTVPVSAPHAPGVPSVLVPA